jgi:hypothetical protein
MGRAIDPIPAGSRSPGYDGLPWQWTPVIWACRAVGTVMAGALAAWLAGRNWWARHRPVEATPRALQESRRARRPRPPVDKAA